MLPLADPDLLKDLRPGESLFLADGTVRLVVLKAGARQALCRVETGGTVRSGSGLNVPDSVLSMKLPTPDDRPVIRFARDEQLEWLGISFVRTPADVQSVRRFLGRGPRMPRLIAKIEKREALIHLNDII
jgi:pyruvate kinase